jgi:hypothetical protein
MASFADVLSPDEVEAIRAFIIARANAVNSPPAPR